MKFLKPLALIFLLSVSLNLSAADLKFTTSWSADNAWDVADATLNKITALYAGDTDKAVGDIPADNWAWSAAEAALKCSTALDVGDTVKAVGDIPADNWAWGVAEAALKCSTALYAGDTDKAVGDIPVDNWARSAVEAALKYSTALNLGDIDKADGNMTDDDRAWIAPMHSPEITSKDGRFNSEIFSKSVSNAYKDQLFGPHIVSLETENTFKAKHQYGPHIVSLDTKDYGGLQYTNASALIPTDSTVGFTFTLASGI